MEEPQEKFQDIYGYILTEETRFRTERVPLARNWDWNMYEHIDRSFSLKNSQFTQGSNDFNRPFNNIIIPIANVNYRTEGFNVKDIDPYVNNADNFHKSFLVRKYHEKWAYENSIDTVIDDSVVSYFDYGLTLVKNVNERKPEVVELQEIAFCDQTNILSGPICLKHYLGIDELAGMKGKWDEDQVNKAILMARTKKESTDDRESTTPTKYVEVYELHGTFPTAWLGEDYMDTDDVGEYSKQLHIITYYANDAGGKSGITLFKGIESKPVFKALKRDKINGRACGRGGIEELFHPQIWTNYDEIHLQQMLEAVSKVVLKTTDPKLAKNNKINNLKHNQILQLQEGTDISQVQIQAINKVAFDNAINKWEQVARTIGSASDPQLGLNPVSGTPLGTTEIVTQEGEGIHEYRQGQIATFWGEIYRDWVLDYLQKDMMRGDEWLDELSTDELRELSSILVTKQTNKFIKEKLLKGSIPTPEDEEFFKTFVLEEFSKGGKKRFLKIVKDEMKGLKLDVRFNIAGRQKNQYEMVSKLNSVFRTVFSNPQILQEPGMEKLFNEILENSGFSPISFSALKRQPVQNAGQNVKDVIEQPKEKELSVV